MSITNRACGSGHFVYVWFYFISYTNVVVMKNASFPKQSHWVAGLFFNTGIVNLEFGTISTKACWLSNKQKDLQLYL